MKSLFIKNKFFIISVLLCVIIAFLSRTDWTNLRAKPFQFSQQGDVDQYYSYLPAFAIKGKNKTFNFDNDRGYWLTNLPNGKSVPKMTIGMAMFYAPFFYIGHGIALNTNYPSDGYSYPYSISLRIGTWLYVLLGFFYTFKTLRFYFSDKTAAFLIFCLFSGTNLWHYTLSAGEMTHSYLFTLFSITVYCTIQWYSLNKRKYLYILSAATGMAVLIRPTSVIALVFPLLYGIKNRHDVLNRIIFFKQNLKSILTSIVLFAFPFFLQMIFWKTQTGSWLFWSYGDEKFYFETPRVVDFLFSYRKGWFLYTPLMLLAVIGLFFSWKNKTSIASFMIVILAVYILSSWWCWWFGGSLGSRVMVEFYAFLIIPLGFIYHKLAEKKILKVFGITVFLLCVGYNLLLEKKYPLNLHWDAMSKKAFWITMSANINGLNKEEEKKYLEALDHPNYENALKGLPE